MNRPLKNMSVIAWWIYSNIYHSGMKSSALKKIRHPTVEYSAFSQPCRLLGAHQAFCVAFLGSKGYFFILM